MEQHTIGTILSTGRTGTQFFEFFINHYVKNAVCYHEPSPSRRFKFYSNMYLNNKLKSDFITKQYRKLRMHAIIRAEPKLYIESNNFLFGCIHALNKEFDVKILHLVRNPKTYIRSHLKHGFWSGHKKFTARYIPYWLEHLDLPYEERNNPYCILARRWVYVNKVIESYNKSNDYLLIRFEDLFSGDTESSLQTMRKTADFFRLKIIPGTKLEEILHQKQNIGKKKKVSREFPEKEEEKIIEICSSFMHKYQYL